MPGRVAALSLLAALSMTAPLAQGDPPNPYGVAGWGVLTQLGMPADCLDYDWNGLHPGTLAQMCRPNHYYNFIGIPPRWWGYDETTGQINDPARFAQWIGDNPGRVWIIANEPDLASQDGLTREQYARMYKTYHDFISSRDPTARFCIGAITGGSTADRLGYTTGWYQYVLNYYQSTYGEPMPIDIWNIHSYCGPTQIEDPDQPIRDFITPFINWCHSVDNGRYDGCEVWITELPIGEWNGALSEEWIIWFAQRYLPRLERAGISRWFWFVSRDNSEWATVALVKSTGVTPIGQAYSALANGYPNEIIPVQPYVPAPTPAYFEDRFDDPTLSAPWMVKAGRWAVDSGVLRQSRINFPWTGETCVLQHTWGDFDATFKMRVNEAIDGVNWAGFAFHVGGRFQSVFQSGYLVFLRRNGSLGLHHTPAGTVREIPAAVADATQFQQVRVQMNGWRIQVWLNGVNLIDYTDAGHRYASGYTILQVHKADCSYDDVQIWTTPNEPPTVSATTISSSHLAANDETTYSVATTASAAEGAAEIQVVEVLLNDDTPDAQQARGRFAWGLTDEAISQDGGGWTIMGNAEGGGRWAWRSDGWGADTYVTPRGATTAVNGTARTVTFTFSAKPAWAPASEQRVHAAARDARGDATGWVLAPAVFRVRCSAPGDLDCDGDVDQEDFGRFQTCFSGPGFTQSDSACEQARLDADLDVDGADVAIFQNCMSGPNTQADPRCAP